MSDKTLSLTEKQIKRLDPCGYGIEYFEPLQVPKEQIELLIVVVCFRAVELTINCLRSLASEIEFMPGIRVAVCENGTNKNAAKRLRQTIQERNWSAWCDLTVISPNRGFSGGNNIVLRQALHWPTPPRHFLLLNADTIVLPGAISELIKGQKLNPNAGIISPRLVGYDVQPRHNCFIHFHPLSELIRSANTGVITRFFKGFNIPMPINHQPMLFNWTSFACALIRREVVDQIGVLDDGYFLYFDDADYCRRAWNAGWQVLNWPASRVVHLEGQSNPLPKLQRLRKRKPWYYYASRSRYYAKFYGRSGLFAANVCWYIGWGIAWLRHFIFGSTLPICEFEKRDIWTNWQNPMRMPSQGQD